MLASIDLKRNPNGSKLNRWGIIIPYLHINRGARMSSKEGYVFRER